MAKRQRTPGARQPAIVHAKEGFRLAGISRRQGYEWVLRGIIPSGCVVKAGRRIYLRRLPLLDWLAGRDASRAN